MSYIVQRFDPQEQVRARNVDVIETEAFRTAPYRFPFIVDDADGTIHEPSLQFLLKHFRNPSRRLNGAWLAATAEARAYDLKDWFQLLRSAGLDWTKADDSTLSFYVTSLVMEPSPVTGRRLTGPTIGRRLDSIYKFYGWAHGQYSDAVFNKDTARAAYGDADLPSELAPEDDDEDEGAERIKPLTPAEYRRLRVELGPLPSEIEEDDVTSCRSRLAVELSLHTGLRVDEVARLSRRKVMGLRPDPDQPAGVCAVLVTLTKRLTPRTVRIPNALVEELHLYDKRERARCIALAETRWLTGAALATRRFFVNTLAAGGDVGKGVRKRSLQNDFRKAVVAAGLTDPGAAGGGHQPAHTFHDLRHTHAVWLYAALTRVIDGKPAWWGGDPPWRVVQKQLGHKHQETTSSRYLRFTEGMASDIGDAVVALFASIRDDE